MPLEINEYIGANNIKHVAKQKTTVTKKKTATVKKSGCKKGGKKK